MISVLMYEYSHVNGGCYASVLRTPFRASSPNKVFSLGKLRHPAKGKYRNGHMLIIMYLVDA